MTSAAPSTVNVLSSKNDINRTGHNAEETYLTTANVTSSTFGRLFSRQIDGQAYAQPLYASNVGGKNLVFVATEHNTIYAFDADDTSASAPPIWSKNLGPSLPSNMTGCGLMSPEIGITGTPVIDLDSKTIWFTSRHLENGKAVHKLNALDIATGNPRLGSPVVITAKANGTGSTSVNGVITFDPLKQLQRPGLLKVGNEIVIGFGSQCDSRDYHGWLLGYDATTLKQNRVHITTPNGGEGSIWNGGVGINADEKGDIYFPGADAYDSASGTSWNGGADQEADSLVHLHDDGGKWVVVSKFTTFDAPTYSPQDRSFGNGGGILIPGSNLYMAGDKRGQLFVVDRDNMGGMVDQDANVVQKWTAAKDLGNPGGGTYFQTGGAGIYYAWGTGDTLKAWKFDGQKFATAPLTNATSSTGYPGVPTVAQLEQRPARHRRPLGREGQAHELRPRGLDRRRRARRLRRLRHHEAALHERRGHQRPARQRDEVRAADRRERQGLRRHIVEPARRLRPQGREPDAAAGRRRRGPGTPDAGPAPSRPTPTRLERRDLDDDLRRPLRPEHARPLRKQRLPRPNEGRLPVRSHRRQLLQRHGHGGPALARRSDALGDRIAQRLAPRVVQRRHADGRPGPERRRRRGADRLDQRRRPQVTSS